MPNARSVLFGFYSGRPKLVRIRLVPGYQVKSVVTIQLKGDSTFARKAFLKNSCIFFTNMTLQWTFAAGFLYAEIGVLLLFCLPFISPKR